MHLNELHLPSQTGLESSEDEPVNVAGWQAAIDAVPLTDPLSASGKIVSLLHDSNRIPCPPSTRLAFLDSNRDRIKTLTAILKGSYGSAAFPLTEAENDKAANVRQLLIELADGYKLVTHALAASQHGEGYLRDELAQALFQALYYTSLVALESYAVYQNAPRGIWKDMHTLYGYSRSFGIHQRELPGDGNDRAASSSIHQTYLQITLVAAANPGHLMQGEAEKMYHLLAQYVHLCQIVPVSRAVSSPLNGKIVIDPNVDRPPYFMLPTATQTGSTDRWMLLDNSKLLEALKETLRQRGQDRRTSHAQLSFMERLETGMYQRLERALGLRSERLSPRQPSTSLIALLNGLTGLYQVVSGGAPFSPEHDEIEIQRRMSDRKNLDHLTLIPLDDSSWKRDDAEVRLDAGINTPRLSSFDRASDNDIWKKVYATPATRQAEKQQEEHQEQLPEPVVCEQKNESRGGLALLFRNSTPLRIRVGNLVAFKQNEAHQDDWHIGSVCWLRFALNRDVTMGLKTLAEDCLPVATKAIKGVGQGGEYFRALLIPNLDPFQYPTTLITPAAVYDAGTVICVNTRHDIFYARLTNLIETTASFSRFRFDTVEISPSL